MLVADAPAVFLGQRGAGWIPYKAVRYIAALLFTAMGVMLLSGIRLLE
jgi:putative Ca2+/H+ antiporter (TMEM165/GDT1 family)